MSRKNPKEIIERVKQLLDDQCEVEALTVSTQALPDELLTPLNLACKTGDEATVSLLLEAGEDPEQRAARQGTPLGFAAGGGHALAIDRFLDEGACLGLVDSCGESALHAAVRGHSAEALDLLLHRGADPNVVDPKGRCSSPC